MRSQLSRYGLTLALIAGFGCASAPAASTRPAEPAASGRSAPQRPGPGQFPRQGSGPRAGQSEGPKPYEEVITDEAITKDGIFKTHEVGDQLYFEIPQSEFGNEMLLLVRRAEYTGATGFFGRGGRNAIVLWERTGNRVTLRERSYDVWAHPDSAIRPAVDALARGPVIGLFSVEAYGPDSSAVVDVTSLYTSSNPEMGSLQSVQSNRSFLNHVAAFPRNIEVEATQTGQTRQGGGGPSPPFPGAGGGNQSGTETARIHWSMLKLPDVPMMARLSDARVGVNSFATIDYGRPEHRAETRRYIRRFRLEKANPDQEVSDPIEPIVYWIDPATPDWLKPYVQRGVDAWQEAFEQIGFSNAIFGRLAPTPDEDPDWSLYDARHSVIYWRPSEVPNATGGQVWDPRSGEILKGEVNMYHNVMNLVRNWYFIQVSPLDPRAQTLPLPDSLMGRLVQYVVTHEIGHSIGFPHNFKASSQYPADSLRSEAFLRRMGGHVATLMDYSRFNYVAQPEDGIPPELLIPQVGPYDKFAIMWAYKPIPDAATPDEEWPTLDRWSRMQDTVPWFRWITSESRNDPGALTEAVGDENAVYSSTLALRNLRRVMDNVISASERPGRDYSMLEELYENALQQWGRYMGHVTAIIGGAQSQEKYGTGRRFDPESRERQREAMRFLNENAFQTPAYFVNEEILRRIETDGVLTRLREAQARVLDALIDRFRIDRLVEYQALADDPGTAYTAEEFMGDLRDGVWGELQRQRVVVDTYRRNLQRAYLDAMNAELNPEPPERPAGQGGFRFGPPPAPEWASDVRPVLRGALVELDRAIEAAAPRAADTMTRLHLQDVRMEIERILHPEQ